jgi:MFS family permease
LLTAGIVYLAIPETRPKADSKKPRKGKADSGQSGYRHVFRDRRYLLFVFALFLVGLLHAQRESTLPVFLRDFYQTTPTQFGFLLSVNALLVLLLQLWVTRRLAAFPQFGVLAAGAVIFGAGFWAFGLAGMYWYFVLAIVIITLGEMMLMPASQALVSSFAPKALTGRYMALYGVSFAIPFALGPALAGLLSSRFGGLSIWRAAGVLGLIAAISFMMLAVWPAPARKKPSKRGKP